MKVAVIHDSEDTTRLFKYLIADIGYEVIWTASTGQQGIDLCKQQLPDLVLVKIELPDISGTEVTRTIVANTSTTVIAVSKSVKKHPAKVFETMSAGALDAFTEPSTEEPESIRDLKRKITNVGKLHKSAVKKQKPDSTKIVKGLPLIAIGSSTGGPAALVEVLSKLPDKPKATIVIIQHMDVEFSEGMAKWVDEQTRIKVNIAKPGEKPKQGIAYIAGTDDHLILNRSGCFEYTADPVDYPYRPSVDVFFESAVTHWPNQIIGVLLTGMGRDGASGLLSFYNRGMLTIAQDEESCAVFGMPKAAIALNAAKKVLHIKEIGDAINDALSSKGSV